MGTTGYQHITQKEAHTNLRGVLGTREIDGEAWLLGNQKGEVKVEAQYMNEGRGARAGLLWPTPHTYIHLKEEVWIWNVVVIHLNVPSQKFAETVEYLRE
jgi:hypothetical protein